MFELNGFIILLSVGYLLTWVWAVPEEERLYGHDEWGYYNVDDMEGAEENIT